MLIESVLAICFSLLYSIGTSDDQDKKKKAWFKSTVFIIKQNIRRFNILLFT